MTVVVSAGAAKHIKVLERAELVRRTGQGRDRVLSLNAGAAEWIEHYRRFWEDRLAALENFVINRRKGAKRARRA